jgi:hypothetical protein
MLLSFLTALFQLHGLYKVECEENYDGKIWKEVAWPILV